MDVFLLAARLVLAGVFLVAGVAKLADLEGTRRGIADFGLPSFMAPALGWVLPLAEIAVAVALIPRASAWLGAVGALVLLLAFVVAIGLNLARGRTPDCRCFGQVYSAPAGRSTLVRNGALAAVGGVLVWQGRVDPGPSVLSLVGSLGPVEVGALVAGVVLFGILIAQGALLFHLLRQNGRLLLRIDSLEQRLGDDEDVLDSAEDLEEAPQTGLPVGSAAPSFSLPGLYGETLTLDFLRAAGKPTLLLFMHPSCGPCDALLPEVAAWQREHAGDLTVAVVSSGDVDANKAKFGEHGLRHVMLENDLEVSKAYQAPSTPNGVLVNPDGTIGSPVAAGADQIRRLTRQVAGQGPELLPMAAPPPAEPAGNGNGAGAHAASTPASLGRPVPSLELPDLKGVTMNLRDLKGRPTLLVFWNPACGFCEQMLDELKAWETGKGKSDPRMVIVSSGSVESNRALGFRSRVLLDQNFAAGTAFGANGTPMAVLIDAEGKVASEVAAGSTAVMALATSGDVAGAT